MHEDLLTDQRWSCTKGFSLEMTAKDVEGLHEISGRLQAGTIVAVPFLPNESDATRLRMASSLRSGGFTPMPHIAARRLTSQRHLEALLEGWAQAQVDRLLIIAGDCAAPEGPYDDSLAVINTGLLARYGVRYVNISGYPEGNPKISQGRLEQAMHTKLQALAGQGIAVEIATQFSFAAEPALEWLAQLRAAGIHAPVRLGVPGPANVRTLLRYAAMCGVSASASVLARYGLSLTQLLGSAGPDRLVETLSSHFDATQHGTVLAHYYPFGGLKKLLTWLDQQTA